MRWKHVKDRYDSVSYTHLDTGDMISKIVVPIAKDETGGTLFDKLAEAGAKLLVETLPHIFDGTAVYEKQPEESPTPYAGMITKQMGLINFGKSAEELERLVRGLNPWPSAFTFWNGKTLKVWESFVVKSEEAGTEKPEPGTVVKTDKKGIYVACGEDVLVLSQVQLEGKKRMDADAFLRGCHIDVYKRQLTYLHKENSAFFFDDLVFSFLRGKIRIHVYKLFCGDKCNLSWKNFFYVVILYCHVFLCLAEYAVCLLYTSRCV